MNLVGHIFTIMYFNGCLEIALVSLALVSLN